MKWLYKLLPVVTLGALVVTIVGSTVYAQTFQTAPMHRIDGKPLPPWAQATLTRDGDMGYVSMTMHTKVGGGLWNIGPDEILDITWKPKDVATNWWVIFNDPDACTDPCGRDDVLAQRFGDDTHPAFGTVGLHWATGHITTSGQWSSAAILWEGNTENLLFGVPLLDADAAEIHLIVRSHGPIKNLTLEELAIAQTTVNGGCPPNTCADPQVAEFLPLAP